MKRTAAPGVTRKTHYNPCRWTAHWNLAYREHMRRAEASRLDVRRQKVWVLNLRGGTVYEARTENVHCEPGLGLAELNATVARTIFQKHLPWLTEVADKHLQGNWLTQTLDIESFFRMVESYGHYAGLVRVARRGFIASTRDRDDLALFIVTHFWRTFGIMRAFLDAETERGTPRAESFVKYMTLWGSAETIHALVEPLLRRQWDVYNTREPTFPLSDTPIMLGDGSTMVAVSPFTMLEVREVSGSSRTHIFRHRTIPSEKMEEFRLRSIRNSFREILFSGRDLLDQWRESAEFRERARYIRSATSFSDFLGLRSALCDSNAAAPMNPTSTAPAYEGDRDQPQPNG